MKKYCKIIPLLAAFLTIIPSFALCGQFKITFVYNGDTVKAEGYDTHCLP